MTRRNNTSSSTTSTVSLIAEDGCCLSVMVRLGQYFFDLVNDVIQVIGLGNKRVSGRA
jgi:riboflavin synthase alpha subunit